MDMADLVVVGRQSVEPIDPSQWSIISFIGSFPLELSWKVEMLCYDSYAFLFFTADLHDQYEI